MIGWVTAWIVEAVITPQTDPEIVDPERVVVYDPDSTDLNAAAQEIDLLAARTQPVSWEIGGGLELRHTVSVAISVEHGDTAEAVRLRDAITTDICLRLVDLVPTFLGVAPEGGQYPTALDWAVDYAPLDDTPKEWATVSVTVTAQLDR